MHIGYPELRLALEIGCAGISTIRPGPIHGQGIAIKRYGILRDAVHTGRAIFPRQNTV